MKKEVNTHGKHPALEASPPSGGCEEITIANRGLPVARLVPVSKNKPKRQLGGYGDTIKISDDFDAPLPDEILDLFDSGNTRTKKKK
jgi:antitoxin (DNA-binding transcriptional repressor) of toxin-antitoxin stability system